MTTTSESPAAPPRPAASPDGRPPDHTLVYRFGAGAADGSAEMGDLLGGKGAGLAEMSALGIPVPPGFTITTEVCADYYARGLSYPPGLEEQVAAGIEHIESIAGTRFGDEAGPLLLSVRSGARVSMPGMMDTVLNLGLNDETVEGLARASGDERFAFDSYPPLRADVRQRGARGQARLRGGAGALRGAARGDEATARRRARHRAHRRRPARPRRPVQGGRPRAERARLPRRPRRAAVGRDRRRLRLLELAPGPRLPRPPRLPLRVGDGRHRTGDGLRQPRRRLRDRRLLHARSGDGSARARRRVPGERAGRGRRRRREDAPEDRCGRTRAAGGPDARGDDAGGPLGARRRRRPPRGPLPRHAGHRVHDPAGPPLDPADAEREAQRLRDGRERRRDGRRGPHRRAGGDPPPGSGAARRAAAPGLPPRGAARGDRARARRLPGSRRRPRRLHAGRGGGGARPRRGRDPGARRDEPGGHRGDVERRRHPDGARRHDLARRRRGAGHGDAVRLRLLGAADRLPPRPLRGSRRGRLPAGGARGRRDLPRRLDRGGDAGRRGARRRLLPARVRAADVLGQRAAPAGRARERRHAGGRLARPRLRRRGDRALPHRAHVLRGGPDPRRPRDDPRRGRRGAPRRARPHPPDAAGRLRGNPARDGRIPRHDPAARPAAPRVPAARGKGAGGTRAGARAPAGGDRPPRRRAAGVQPDARAPGRPARDHLSRDLRDPGEGDHRGGVRARRRGGRRPPRDHDPAGQHGGGARRAPRARGQGGGADDGAAPGGASTSRSAP